MRKALIVSALMAAGVSLPAMADDEYFDKARVLAVTPQVERVNYPTQSCHTEYVRESYGSNARSPVGAIIGGVAGGLLGSQIGKGNGRVAGAAVGAGVGAVVGDRIGNSQAATTYGTRPVERCVTVDNWQTVNRGYLVTYRYNGRDYTTMMDHDPGRTIPVRVSVSANSHVSNITYYKHSYDVPTYVPGYPVAGYRPQSFTYNIQYSHKDDRARDWKKGNQKAYKQQHKHDQRDRRYY
ncbi:hypothetical protein MTYP_02202 [Methylophilaceae bacterium]|nr:hypothetical protein MTYP_02202 [Methylophilaceae bacterium]